MRERYGLARGSIHLDRPLDPASYSYLLGLYLGDGHIARTRKGYVFIRFSLDRAYPRIAEECREAILRATPARASVQDRAGSGLLIVQSSGRFWLDLFPQHGPGKKHQREIRLADWQEEITHEFTREFLRGLIHSDGSRCINRFSIALPGGKREYEYPRYFFTNYSADIRRIFCEHCDLLGVRWTQSNARNISVSNRAGVALLDEFIGPKR